VVHATNGEAPTTEGVLGPHWGHPQCKWHVWPKGWAVVLLPTQLPQQQGARGRAHQPFWHWPTATLHWLCYPWPAPSGATTTGAAPIWHPTTPAAEVATWLATVVWWEHGTPWCWVSHYAAPAQCVCALGVWGAQ